MQNSCLFCKKKHTFSILHTHFYKTSISIYLFYHIFYLNNNISFIFYDIKQAIIHMPHPPFSWWCWCWCSSGCVRWWSFDWFVLVAVWGVVAWFASFCFFVWLSLSRRYHHWWQRLVDWRSNCIEIGLVLDLRWQVKDQIVFWPFWVAFGLMLWQISGWYVDW